MTLLSGQPLSRLQHSLRGRNVRDMSDAQLRDCIGACTKGEVVSHWCQSQARL
jgi:hypothetical protein